MPCLGIALSGYQQHPWERAQPMSGSWPALPSMVIAMGLAIYFALLSVRELARCNLPLSTTLAFLIMPYRDNIILLQQQKKQLYFRIGQMIRCYDVMWFPSRSFA